MFKAPQFLTLTSAMASHAAQRHSVISENIAHANTPGYQAKDLEPFSEIFHKSQTPNMSLSDMSFEVRPINVGDALSPNGNSVSLEDQMMRSAQTQSDHEISLMLYKKSLQLMKMAIGKNL